MSSLYENLRQLITVVDELRDVGLQQFISLPRIAAIGTQSSGKSSLIESIVGLDFLPRGGGVVTRRPLELRLVHLNTQEYQGDHAWAIFDRNPEKKLLNFNDVRAEIERQTDEVAGKNKGIVNDPIVLTIYATGAPDLTLIDLPGITRVALKGSDQVEDIEKLTRDMTNHYITDPRTIILAVLPANQDVSTSDSLQLARQVDPQGLRTIGVVTKIDIMDQGTDASKMLRGEDIPLRLGYVGVKMRSQQDIQQAKPVKDALKDEKDWFENGPMSRVYSKLPPGHVGTPVLISKLTNVLLKHIRRFLPEIKKEISERRRTTQDRLDELGSGVPLDDAERVQLMWTMITDYCEMFKNTIRGKYDRKLQKYMAAMPNHMDASVSGGARVRAIMNDFLQEFHESSITAEMSDEDIDRAIRMHEGDSLPGFPSPDTFEFLALPHLQKVAMPSVECVHSVSAALDTLSQRMASAVFRRFPRLCEASLTMTQTIIERERDHTRVIVEQQVACHTGYLFTNDPIYLIEHGSMEPMYNGKPPPPPKVEEVEVPKDPSMVEKTFQSAKEGSINAYQKVSTMVKGPAAKQRQQQRYSGPYVNEIRSRLDSYFAIMIRNVRDSIPKAIGFYLVRAVQDKLQFELNKDLNNSLKIQELLGEPPHILEERKQLAAQLAVLSKAAGVLTRDPTLAAIAMEALEDEMEAPASAPKATAPKPAGVPAAAPAPGGAGGFAPASRPAAAPATTQAPAGSMAPAVPAVAPGSRTGAAPPAAVPAAAPRPAAAPTGGGLFGSSTGPSAKAGLFDDSPTAGVAPKKAGAQPPNPLFG